VAGVIPYLHELGIDEEDSVPLEGLRGRPGGDDGAIDVAVLYLPHISNFTDFDALGWEPGIALRYVRMPAELGQPEAVIIPGSKNTIGDLEHLKRNGTAQAVVRLAECGTPVLGICGGFQMLGEGIADPDGVEGGRRRVDGLGLLPVSTELTGEKLTCQVRAEIATALPLLRMLPGEILTGYEIHMGRSRATGAVAPFVIRERGGEAVREDDGCISRDGNVLGTYLHGLFDNAAVRQGFAAYLAGRRGIVLPEAPAPALDEYKEDRFNRLAAEVRSSVDMDLIYRLIGLS
jgi:adenosylcobyric acid synthase